MKISEAIERLVAACREDKKSRATWETYASHVRKYCRWLLSHPMGTNEGRVSAYLRWLAPNAAQSTHDQALNALVFFYKSALKMPLGDLGDIGGGQRRKRLPVWLSHAEFESVARHLDGAMLEMAQIMFGAGLRRNECLHLRVRDLDFDTGVITVRGGKGDKDRNTCFPRAIVPAMRERLRRLHDLWMTDQDRKVPGVWLPDDVGRKYPNYGKDWQWQWVFPTRGLVHDKISGITRRHHLHEDTLAKALKRAAVAARLTKRITVHALRHSFATAFLANGGAVHQLQELLGHAHLETTEVYLHCIPQFAQCVTSPLDARPNVVPFAVEQATVAVPLRRLA